MEDIILSRDELKQLFIKKEIKDTGKGWFYKDKEVELIALHEIEPKYLLDVARAETYKIRFKDN